MNVTRHSCHIGKLCLIGRRVKGDKACIRWTHACIDPERWMELMQWVFQIWLSLGNKCRQGSRIHKSSANEGERERKFSFKLYFFVGKRKYIFISRMMYIYIRLHAQYGKIFEIVKEARKYLYL